MATENGLYLYIHKPGTQKKSTTEVYKLNKNISDYDNQSKYPDFCRQIELQFQDNNANDGKDIVGEVIAANLVSNNHIDITCNVPIYGQTNINKILSMYYDADVDDDLIQERTNREKLAIEFAQTLAQGLNSVFMEEEAVREAAIKAEALLVEYAEVLAESLEMPDRDIEAADEAARQADRIERARNQARDEEYSKEQDVKALVQAFETISDEKLLAEEEAAAAATLAEQEAIASALENSPELVEQRRVAAEAEALIVENAEVFVEGLENHDTLVNERRDAAVAAALLVEVGEVFVEGLENHDDRVGERAAVAADLGAEQQREIDLINLSESLTYSNEKILAEKYAEEVRILAPQIQQLYDDILAIKARYNWIGEGIMNIDVKNRDLLYATTSLTNLPNLINAANSADILENRNKLQEKITDIKLFINTNYTGRIEQLHREDAQTFIEAMEYPLREHAASVLAADLEKRQDAQVFIEAMEYPLREKAAAAAADLEKRQDAETFTAAMEMQPDLALINEANRIRNRMNDLLNRVRALLGQPQMAGGGSIDPQQKLKDIKKIYDDTNEYSYFNFTNQSKKNFNLMRKIENVTKKTYEKRTEYIGRLNEQLKLVEEYAEEIFDYFKGQDAEAFVEVYEKILIEKYADEMKVIYDEIMKKYLILEELEKILKIKPPETRVYYKIQLLHSVNNTKNATSSVTAKINRDNVHFNTYLNKLNDLIFGYTSAIDAQAFTEAMVAVNREVEKVARAERAKRLAPLLLLPPIPTSPTPISLQLQRIRLAIEFAQGLAQAIELSPVPVVAVVVPGAAVAPVVNAPVVNAPVAVPVVVVPNQAALDDASKYIVLFNYPLNTLNWVLTRAIKNPGNTWTIFIYTDIDWTNKWLNNNIPDIRVKEITQKNAITYYNNDIGNNQTEQKLIFDNYVLIKPLDYTTDNGVKYYIKSVQYIYIQNNIIKVLCQNTDTTQSMFLLNNNFTFQLKDDIYKQEAQAFAQAIELSPVVAAPAAQANALPIPPTDFFYTNVADLALVGDQMVISKVGEYWYPGIIRNYDNQKKNKYTTNDVEYLFQDEVDKEIEKCQNVVSCSSVSNPLTIITIISLINYQNLKSDNKIQYQIPLNDKNIEKYQQSSSSLGGTWNPLNNVQTITSMFYNKAAANDDYSKYQVNIYSDDDLYSYDVVPFPLKNFRFKDKEQELGQGQGQVTVNGEQKYPTNDSNDYPSFDQQNKIKDILFRQNNENTSLQNNAVEYVVQQICQILNIHQQEAVTTSVAALEEPGSNISAQSINFFNITNKVVLGLDDNNTSYDIKYFKAIGDGTCAIHSFLTVCSSTYRKLSFNTINYTTNDGKYLVGNAFRYFYLTKYQNITQDLNNLNTPLNAPQQYAANISNEIFPWLAPIFNVNIILISLQQNNKLAVDCQGFINEQLNTGFIYHRNDHYEVIYLNDQKYLLNVNADADANNVLYKLITYCRTNKNDVSTIWIVLYNPLNSNDYYLCEATKSTTHNGITWTILNFDNSNTYSIGNNIDKIPDNRVHKIIQKSEILEGDNNNATRILNEYILTDQNPNVVITNIGKEGNNIYIFTNANNIINISSNIKFTRKKLVDAAARQVDGEQDGNSNDSAAVADQKIVTIKIINKNTKTLIKTLNNQDISQFQDLEAFKSHYANMYDDVTIQEVINIEFNASINNLQNVQSNDVLQIDVVLNNTKKIASGVDNVAAAQQEVQEEQRLRQEEQFKDDILRQDAQAFVEALEAALDLALEDGDGEEEDSDSSSDSISISSSSSESDNKDDDDAEEMEEEEDLGDDLSEDLGEGLASGLAQDEASRQQEADRQQEAARQKVTRQEAATKLQTTFRGFTAKKNVTDLKENNLDLLYKQDAMAIACALTSALFAAAEEEKDDELHNFDFDFNNVLDNFDNNVESFSDDYAKEVENQFSNDVDSIISNNNTAVVSKDDGEDDDDDNTVEQQKVAIADLITQQKAADLIKFIKTPVYDNLNNLNILAEYGIEALNQVKQKSSDNKIQNSIKTISELKETSNSSAASNKTTPSVIQTQINKNLIQIIQTQINKNLIQIIKILNDYGLLKQQLNKQVYNIYLQNKLMFSIPNSNSKANTDLITEINKLPGYFGASEKASKTVKQITTEVSKSATSISGGGKKINDLSPTEIIKIANTLLEKVKEAEEKGDNDKAEKYNEDLSNILKEVTAKYGPKDESILKDEPILTPPTNLPVTIYQKNSSKSFTLKHSRGSPKEELTQTERSNAQTRKIREDKNKEIIRVKEAEKKVIDDKKALDEQVENNRIAKEQEEARVQADKALADKALADKALAEKKVIADKALAEKALAEKALAEKALADKALADLAEKALADLAEKALAEKALAEKALAEKALADLAEKALTEKKVIDDKALAEKKVIADQKAQAEKALADLAADKALETEQADKALAEQKAQAKQAEQDRIAAEEEVKVNAEKDEQSRVQKDNENIKKKIYDTNTKITEMKKIVQTCINTANSTFYRLNKKLTDLIAEFNKNIPENIKNLDDIETKYLPLYEIFSDIMQEIKNQDKYKSMYPCFNNSSFENEFDNLKKGGGSNSTKKNSKKHEQKQNNKTRKRQKSKKNKNIRRNRKPNRNKSQKNK